MYNILYYAFNDNPQAAEDNIQTARNVQYPSKTRTLSHLVQMCLVNYLV